jgi:hypothetical protein
MSREGADGVLVLNVELLSLEPVGNPHLLLSCGRTVAEARAGRDKLVLEFLSYFAEHVPDYIERRLFPFGIARRCRNRSPQCLLLLKGLAARLNPIHAQPAHAETRLRP